MPDINMAKIKNTFTQSLTLSVYSSINIGEREVTIKIRIAVN
jgi:hypothetical protein